MQGKREEREDVHRMAEANRAFSHYRGNGEQRILRNTHARVHAIEDYRNFGIMGISMPARRPPSASLLYRAREQIGECDEVQRRWLDGAGAGARHHDQVAATTAFW